MYIKFEDREKGKLFTFFSREIEMNGEKVSMTEKCVFGTLSDSVRVGEVNGKTVYEHDYWNGVFCGKALEKAKNLKNKDRICVTEMIIRNRYIKEKRTSFSQICVTDFDILEKPDSEHLEKPVKKPSSKKPGKKSVKEPDEKPLETPDGEYLNFED